MKFVRLGNFIEEHCEKNKKGENIPVFSVTNTNGFCTEYFSKDVSSKDKSNYKIVHKGFFAYNPSRINVGSVDWLRNEDKVIVSPLYNVFSVSPELEKQYLFYFLKSERGKTLIKSKAEGSVRDNLKFSILADFPIPMPSVEEQRKFVAKLDKASELILKYKKLLEYYDSLIKSRFIEMFGDIQQYEKLSAFSTLITKGASPRWQGIEYTDEGTLFITSENVRERFIDYSKKKFLPDNINDILPRSILKKNDVLINIVGASIGRAAIFDSDLLANINQAVALVRLDSNKIDELFLVTYLNSEKALKMYSEMKKGGARDNLSLQNISDLKIPICDLKSQKKFASFVQQIDKSKFDINFEEKAA